MSYLFHFQDFLQVIFYIHLSLYLYPPFYIHLFYFMFCYLFLTDLLLSLISLINGYFKSLYETLPWRWYWNHALLAILFTCFLSLSNLKQFWNSACTFIFSGRSFFICFCGLVLTLPLSLFNSFMVWSWLHLLPLVLQSRNGSSNDILGLLLYFKGDIQSNIKGASTKLSSFLIMRIYPPHSHLVIMMP